MFRKRLILLLVCAVVMTANHSCRKTYPANDSDLSDDTPGSEDVSDYIWENSGIANIVLNGSSISTDNSSVTIAGSKATITAGGDYNITGSLGDGQIVVDTKDSKIVRLILNGVNITCSNSSPIFIKKAAKALVVLPDNTNNFITDGSSYIVNSDNEPNAALFSKSYLAFYGNGSLTVKANFEDGITSKDGLVVKSGKLNVTSVDDGIRGKDYFIARKGNITINSTGDGLKSDNDTDPAMGYITIDSAVMNITAAADGINATTNLKINDGSFTITTGGGGSTGTGGYSGTISKKALKAAGTLDIEKGTIVINSTDDALHSNSSVIINDGTISITSGDDAIHAESAVTINGGNVNILKSYEGIESASITISGGVVSLVSSDDAFNATKGLTAGGGEANDGSQLNINGGFVTVNTTSGDGLDSNGNATITGGTIVIQGPQSQPEVAFDINGTFSVNGGFLIGSGPNSGNMIEGPATSSSQNSIKATSSSNLTSSTLFHIQDAEGKNIVTFKPVRSTYYIVVSSPDLASGASYSIYTGGSSTGTNNSGLYTEGIYSGGTLKKSFTMSAKLTSVSF